MKVVVLGAGVVGATTAYWLARDGHDVTVIDRSESPGLETSFANGGQISVSHAAPWAAPDTPGHVLKWLGRADAPLLLRFRFDAAMWAWIFRFLGQCTPARARLNTERTLRIALYSRTVLDALNEEEPIDYDRRRDGILHFYRDSKTFEHAAKVAEQLNALGLRQRVLSARDVVTLEPTLAGQSARLAGGTFSPDDESGDAYAFTVAISRRAAELGADFRLDTTVQSLATDGRSVTGVVTDQGTITADRVVVSLGAYSPLLLKPLGLPLPIYPAKGYSVTLPLSAPEKAPHVSLTDDERKHVYSRLGDSLRIAGTAELAGYDTSVNEARARSILASALEIFPGCGDPAQATLWAGLRPKTPDSVPVIGRTPYRNLLMNTGHGTLGWTMAAGSGKLIADLIAGRTPAIRLDGLEIKRFG